VQAETLDGDASGRARAQGSAKGRPSDTRPRRRRCVVDREPCRAIGGSASCRRTTWLLGSMDGGREGRDDQETLVSGCGGQLPNGGAPTAGRMWVLCYGEGGAERNEKMIYLFFSFT
jgi:hypothetical protein